jgi:hypothetical protein
MAPRSPTHVPHHLILLPNDLIGISQAHVYTLCIRYAKVVNCERTM